MTIVDTPEGNTTDDILVTLYNLEEIEITLVEEFLCLLVKSLHVWIVLLLKFKLLADFRTAESFRIRKHVHIQLSQHHLDTFTCKSLDALLILSIIRIIKTIVALHTYSIDAETLRLQIANQLADSLSLGWLRSRIIIIVKLYVRVSLMRKAESQFDELRTDNLII